MLVVNVAMSKAEGRGGHSSRTMADDPATLLDEAHVFEPHYDRHVWPYRANPAGIFTAFNPAVSGAHHKAHHAAAR